MTAPRHAFVYKRSRPDLKDAGSNPQDRLLNIDQVRRRLNCSKSHVYNLIQMGELPAVTLGESKGKRVYESEVETYLSRKNDVTSVNF
jgi:excisionase family DNA binding protein